MGLPGIRKTKESLRDVAYKARVESHYTLKGARATESDFLLVFDIGITGSNRGAG